MRLTFERDLQASASAAWPFLTDPERMNRWSGARVTSLAPGDGGDPGGVGALREIAIPMPATTVVFDEVIEEAEPAARLVYRVVSGIPVRRHRGVVTLREDGAGAARLLWEVEAEFPLPGMETIFGTLVARKFAASLDALQREVRGAAPGAPLPSPRRIDESAALAGLFAAADGLAARQKALADRLAAAKDPKQWFARVYQYVSEAQIARCRAGDFAHPAWVLRLLPRFHAYFEENLMRFAHDAPGFPETHWRSSFRAMEKAAKWQGDEVRGLFYGVAKGMQAHIEEDLPRALAEVYAKHYAGRCDYARFRADYLRMGPIFAEAGDRLGAHIPRSRLPLRSRILGAILPREAIDWLVARDFYDLPRERRRAFERGERIAKMLPLPPDGQRAG